MISPTVRHVVLPWLNPSVTDKLVIKRHGFELGSTIEILDRDFTVVGLSDGTNSWMASFLFIEKRAADRVLWLEDGEFKDTVELAVDPVCGMSVDRETAPARVEHNGQVFHFCARGCKDEFLGSPEKFLKQLEEWDNRVNIQN